MQSTSVKKYLCHHTQMVYRKMEFDLVASQETERCSIHPPLLVAP